MVKHLSTKPLPIKAVIRHRTLWRTKDHGHFSHLDTVRKLALTKDIRWWEHKDQIVGVVSCYLQQVQKLAIQNAICIVMDFQKIPVSQYLGLMFSVLSETANFILGGGQDVWSVQLTGVDNSVGSIQDSDSSASSSSESSSKPTTSNPPAAATPSPDTSKNSPPSVVTKASTVVVTAPGQTKASVPSETVTSNSKGPNKAGIAAGIIVGILAVGAIIGGLFFFLRNRKRRALEEEYHRQSANSAAARGQPTSMSSMSDSRLEPSVMMQRRQSDGSIADYHDYSRRILKVSSPLSYHF